MDLLQSIRRQTDFSLSLTKHVISTEAKDTNFVFSPLLIHVVLGMCAGGAGGPAREQFLHYLKSKSVEDLSSLSSLLVTQLFGDGGRPHGPNLSVAIGVWVDQSLTFKPDFEQLLQNSYKAVSDRVDFQTQPDKVIKEVNAWAEKETNGLIKEVLPSGSVNPLTRLILANALYFKGAWEDRFPTSRTSSNNFFLLNGGSIRVPFMTMYRQQYIRTFDDFKVLRLPYKHGKGERSFSMYVFLPNAIYGLPALVDKFGSVPGFIEHHLPYERVPTRDFRIPKFKIDSGFEASEVVKGHGLVLPFSPGGMTEMVNDSAAGKELFVSGMFQKSFIEVDEHGTEAASAFAVMYGGGGPPPKVFDFVADHPFLFVIREDVSGVVLFVGQVVNPLSA